jgi:hypothetical protein
MLLWPKDLYCRNEFNRQRKVGPYPYQDPVRENASAPTEPFEHKDEMKIVAKEQDAKGK